jgi:hypothetical protein
VFDDLPILDIEIKTEKNNNTIVLYFPKQFIKKNIYLLV